jgi:hypothetical protein
MLSNHIRMNLKFVETAGKPLRVAHEIQNCYMTHLPKKSFKINLSVSEHMKMNMHLNIISGMEKQQHIGRNLNQ